MNFHKNILLSASYLPTKNYAKPTYTSILTNVQNHAKLYKTLQYRTKCHHDSNH